MPGGFKRHKRHNLWCHSAAARAVIKKGKGKKKKNRYATLVVTIEAKSLAGAMAKFESALNDM